MSETCGWCTRESPSERAVEKSNFHMLVVAVVDEFTVLNVAAAMVVMVLSAGREK